MPTMKSFTSGEVTQDADCPARLDDDYEPQGGTTDDF